jgi:hypothetical protein
MKSTLCCRYPALAEAEQLCHEQQQLELTKQCPGEGAHTARVREGATC